MQASAGIESRLPWDLRGSATLFRNVFLNMSDSAGTSSNDVSGGGFTDSASDPRSQGSAIGLELSLKRSMSKRVSGFVAYTASRSQRMQGRESFPSAFDRTHVANAAVRIDLGRRYLVGARTVVYSGTPKSSPSNGLIVAPRSSSPDRSPAFYRLDLRFEKQWRVGERGWFAFVAEVLNATLSKETFSSTTGPDRTIGAAERRCRRRVLT